MLKIESSLNWGFKSDITPSSRHPELSGIRGERITGDIAKKLDLN